jgi:hypothetical protein
VAAVFTQEVALLVTQAALPHPQDKEMLVEMYLLVTMLAQEAAVQEQSAEMHLAVRTAALLAVMAALVWLHQLLELQSPAQAVVLAEQVVVENFLAPSVALAVQVAAVTVQEPLVTILLQPLVL